MRCEKCKIEFGGDLKECPFCKGKLTGEPERAYWPEPHRLKKESKIYKRLMMILVFACIAAFVVDLVFDPIKQIQWWPLFVVWAIVAAIIIRAIFKKHSPTPKIITDSAIAFCVLLLLTAIWFPFAFYIVPFVLTGLVAADFIVAVMDNVGYTIIYLLWSILVGVVLFFIGFFAFGQRSVMWYVCISTCAAAFIAILALKGKFIFSEIRRRVAL